ncbi:hypothetical protein VTN00DRAFT_3745 [Thermoascus crustaceus]|uniref:uncharacterized protein n=1 Tax=Thermoascus crustaceus TaxID=5088 RepID=UPI00374295E8
MRSALYPRIRLPRAAVRAHHHQAPFYSPLWSYQGFQTRFNSKTASNQQKQSDLSTTLKPNDHETPLFKPTDRLSGRTCMVTGGTSGIGYAIAERFLQEGAKRVILVGRSYPRLLNAATRLEQATTMPAAIAEETGSDVATRCPEEDINRTAKAEVGGKEKKELSPGAVIAASERVSLLVGDVSSAEEWMRELEREMESVDILINAAGISINNILPKVSPTDITQTLRTNLEGAILTSRALLRASLRSALKQKNHNRGSTNARPVSKCIINISSLLAYRGGTGAIPYAASKAGLLGLTRSLAAEAAETLRAGGGVTVRSNAIVPGYIDTPMIEYMSNDELSRLKETIPLRRLGDPQEIADAAVFLAQNEYANNCVLNLDGGLSAI